MMFAREVRLTTGNKFAVIALGAVLLVIIGVFLAFGFLLVVGLTAAGLLLGAGAALYRRLTGQPTVMRSQMRSQHGLDPALEVAPPPAAPERQDRVGRGEPPL